VDALIAAVPAKM
jgi:hypothetical protein